MREGGHDIPAEVVRRHYHTGWRNFQEVYRRAVDVWMLYDASEREPRIIAQGARNA